MDIVVTIPKSEYKNDDLEARYFTKNAGSFQFWTMNRIPKNIKEGDRIYFVKNSKIESSMNIFTIGHNTHEKCEVTNRNWQGKCVLYLDDLRYEDIDMQVKGFQGFRYKWWEED